MIFLFYTLQIPPKLWRVWRGSGKTTFLPWGGSLLLVQGWFFKMYGLILQPSAYRILYTSTYRVILEIIIRYTAGITVKIFCKTVIYSIGYSRVHSFHRKFSRDRPDIRRRRRRKDIGLICKCKNIRLVYL